MRECVKERRVRCSNEDLESTIYKRRKYDVMPSADAHELPLTVNQASRPLILDHSIFVLLRKENDLE